MPAGASQQYATSHSALAVVVPDSSLNREKGQVILPLCPESIRDYLDEVLVESEKHEEDKDKENDHEQIVAPAPALTTPPMFLLRHPPTPPFRHHPMRALTRRP